MEFVYQIDRDSKKDGALSLLKAQQNSSLNMILQCQKKCLQFKTAEVTAVEQDCLFNCADKYTFFDNTTYELDSAVVMSAQQNKPKKGFMFYNRRIEDLTSLPNK